MRLRTPCIAGAALAATVLAGCGAGSTAPSKNIGRRIRREFYGSVVRQITPSPTGSYSVRLTITRCPAQRTGLALGQLTVQELESNGYAMAFNCAVEKSVQARRHGAPSGTVTWAYSLFVNQNGRWRAVYQPFRPTAISTWPCSGALCQSSVGGRPPPTLASGRRIVTASSIGTSSEPKWGPGLEPMSAAAGAAAMAEAQTSDAPCMAVAVASADRMWALAERRPSRDCQNQAGGSRTQAVLEDYRGKWQQVWAGDPDAGGSSCPPGLPDAVIEAMFRRAAAKCSSL